MPSRTDTGDIFKVDRRRDRRNKNIIGKRRRVSRPRVEPTLPVLIAMSNDNSYVINKEPQSMTLFESTKMTATMALNPENNKR